MDVQTSLKKEIITYLVTGATGYIGLNTIKMLHKNEKYTQENINIILHCRNRAKYESMYGDMENDKILTLQEIFNKKNLNQEEVQNKIFNKINDEIQKVIAIEDSGYNVYKRDINSEIYKIENVKEYFLGKDNVLYIVYAYGNSDYTSEVDLIIFE